MVTMEIRNPELKFDIEMLQDVIAGYTRRGELDTPDAIKSQARLNSLLAKVGTFEANRIPTGAEPERRDLTARPQAGARAANQFGDFSVKVASEAQIRYIKRLIAERDVTQAAMTIPAITDRLSKKVASSVIDILHACPVRVEKQAEVAAASLATEKQIASIQREATRRQFREAITAVVIDQIRKGEPVDRRDASAALDDLFNAPFQPRETTPAAALEIGIYRTGLGIFKVYPNQSKERMLAKILRVVTGEDASWEYVGMAARFVTPEQKLTLEQAKEFGRITGICCNCGRMLTDEGSIAAGIGPVCSKRFR